MFGGTRKPVWLQGIEEGGEQRGKGDQRAGLRCRGSSAMIRGAGDGGGRGASENK